MYLHDSWFRARFSNKSTVILAGTASKVIMTPEFEEDMKEQGMKSPERTIHVDPVDPGQTRLVPAPNGSRLQNKTHCEWVARLTRTVATCPPTHTLGASVRMTRYRHRDRYQTCCIPSTTSVQLKIATSRGGVKTITKTAN